MAITIRTQHINLVRPIKDYVVKLQVVKRLLWYYRIKSSLNNNSLKT